METWLPIDWLGLENNVYWISDHGQLKSFKRYRKGKIARPTIIKGYYHVGLRVNDKTMFFAIARLVAQAFIPNPSNKEQVNHINGDKLDNRANNLEWVTRSENIKHSYNAGIHKGMKGTKNPQSKLTGEDVREILRLRFKEKWILKKIAQKYNIDRSQIGLICNGKAWTHISKRVLEK